MVNEILPSVCDPCPRRHRGAIVHRQPIRPKCHHPGIADLRALTGQHDPGRRCYADISTAGFSGGRTRDRGPIALIGDFR
jgi:hypothetical protein